MTEALPVIAISSGDPAGIGPELALMACADRELSKLCKIIVIGSSDLLRRRANQTGLPVPGDYDAVSPVEHSILNIESSYDVQSGKGAKAGETAGACISRAVELCLENSADAMVTCPIDKESLKAGGYDFPGHTEMIASLTNTTEFRMAFISPQMKLVLNSTHLSLREAVDQVKEERVLESLYITDNSYWKLFGVNPRIAVCALNPHAGEGGLLGSEEKNEIIPAITRARRENIRVEGPFSPDTFFPMLIKSNFDIALAMYHDQGLIALKTLGFLNSVNFTLGLPIIRTSVDHGVAYDMVGKGVADPSSLIAAIKQAVFFARRS